MVEILREIVLEQPTLYASKQFDKLKTNCIYFLIEKGDYQINEHKRAVGILKYLDMFKLARKVTGLTMAVSDMSEDELAEYKSVHDTLSGWYLIDPFYPWHSSFHSGQWDNKIEESDLSSLLGCYHLIEIENKYIDSSHIPDTDKKYARAISEICDKIAKIKHYN